MKLKKSSGLFSVVLAAASVGRMQSTVHADTVKVNVKNVKKIVSNKQAENETPKFEVVAVKAGDTTWDIAQEHHTTVDQVVEDNNLDNNGSLIHIDDQLRIRTGQHETANKEIPSSETDIQSYNNTATNPSDNQVAHAATTTPTAPQASQQIVQSNTPSQSGQVTSSLTSSEKEAKEWIAARESGGSYTAVNPRTGTYGKYQLSQDKLHGDYSPANQEKVADNYVSSRYGSWTAAKATWMQQGWY